MQAPVAFITDAPDVTSLSAGDVKRTRIQIAKTGRFKDPRYGTFSITPADFQSWVRNFRAIHLADDRIGLPVDVDHRPEKEGNTEAAGWIKDIDTLGKDGKTHTPDELWATVEFNSLGVELVSDKRYAYLSPSYTHNYKDETGKSHGTALVGVALTNRPFLTMATVSLSKVDPFASELPDEDAMPDSHEQMPTLSTGIAAALGVDADADEATVLSAIQSMKPSEPADINLDDLAKSQGKVVLSAEQVQSLTADAEAGRKAAEQLSEMTFSTAWDTAVNEGRKVPAERDIYVKLYNVDPEGTLKALKEAPVVLSMELQGSGASDPSLSTPASESEGYSVDKDRDALHQKTLSIMAERNLDYGTALEFAVQGA